MAGRVSTATVLDVGEGRGHLGTTIVRRCGHVAIGRAVTVRTGAGDNLALHRAVAMAAPGDVLVVSCPGPPVGLAGEIICTALRVLGAAGLVTDSGVRDLDDLAEAGPPVWSAAISPLGTTKNEPGTVGEPIEIAGVRVASGDVIVADGDGVVCVPRADWARVREAAAHRQETESVWLAELRRRRPLGSLTGLGAAPPA